MRHRIPTTIAVSTAAAALSVAACQASTATSHQPRHRPGATSAGDHWFPGYGNGGYDAQHYAIDMTFRPQTFTLDATTTMTARATQNLSRFSVDLDGLHVSSVEVDGRRAGFTRTGHKLVITPTDGIDDGRRFRLRVAYAGSPHPIGSGPTRTGFLRTTDGAFTVTNDIASDTWFPNNDTPSDKATYRTSVTAPRSLTVVSNGTLQGKQDHGDSTTTTWAENASMASYLNTVDIGHFEIRTGRTPGGVPEYVAVDPKLNGTDAKHPDAMPFVYDTTARVTDEWTRLFGPYPFDSTGGIVDFTDIDGKPAGYSEETQTRPVYGSVLDPIDIAHELAHQWFGDSVSITDFDDIWLNEGFATWAAYYWDGEHGGVPVQTMVRRNYAMFPASSAYWRHPVSPAAHDRSQTGGARIYFGGAMALEFLREKLGDATFFRILRAWTSAHRHRNATTADFVRTAGRISGKDLTAFFRQWVYGTGRPALPS